MFTPQLVWRDFNASLDNQFDQNMNLLHEHHTAVAAAMVNGGDNDGNGQQSMKWMILVCLKLGSDRSMDL